MFNSAIEMLTMLKINVWHQKHKGNVPSTILFVPLFRFGLYISLIKSLSDKNYETFCTCKTKVEGVEGEGRGLVDDADVG